MDWPFGQGEQRLDRSRKGDRARCLGKRLHVGYAAFAGLHDRRIHRDAPEERYAFLGRHRLGASPEEDIGGLAAVRADKSAHVLDDAQDGQVQLVAEHERLAHVGHGDLLRRGDDHGASAVAEQFGESERLVAGAGWGVYHETIEMAPVDPGQQFADGGVLAGATPDHGIVVVGQEKLDGHHPEPLAHLGRGDAAGDPWLGLVAKPEQARHAGAVQIDIEQADTAPGGGQGRSQVDCHGTLADAAFAREHEEFVADQHHAHVELILLISLLVGVRAAALCLTALRVAFTHRSTFRWADAVSESCTAPHTCRISAAARPP